MGRLLNVATVVLGLYLGWRHFFGAPPAPPPTVAGLHADIEIYTTPQCPYCRDAKAYMDERGIDYLEKDVETDLEARKEFHQRGGRGVPYLFVYGEPMRGFNRDRFEKIRWENR